MREFTGQRLETIKAEDVVGIILEFYDISVPFETEFGMARRVTVRVAREGESKKTLLTSHDSPLARDIQGMFGESNEPFTALLTTSSGKRGRTFYCLEAPSGEAL